MIIEKLTETSGGLFRQTDKNDFITRNKFSWDHCKCSWPEVYLDYYCKERFIGYLFSFFRCLEKHLSTILVYFVAVVIFVKVVAAAAAVAIDVVVFVDVAAPATAVVASDVVVVIVEVIKREHWVHNRSVNYFRVCSLNSPMPWSSHCSKVTCYEFFRVLVIWLLA